MFSKTSIVLAFSLLASVAKANLTDGEVAAWFSVTDQDKDLGLNVTELEAGNVLAAFQCADQET